jgi:hypothetical protein
MDGEGLNYESSTQPSECLLSRPGNTIVQSGDLGMLRLCTFCEIAIQSSDALAYCCPRPFSDCFLFFSRIHEMIQHYCLGFKKRTSDTPDPPELH